MRTSRSWKLLFTALVALACGGCATTANRVVLVGDIGRPDMPRVLDAMRHANTWGHPDLFGQYAGMERYFDGEYEAAIKYFKIGARYADKVSQFALGLMYYNGEGVSKNLASACAWLQLAAERGYPNYVDAHTRMCAPLTAAQHKQAEAKYQALLEEYGDHVARQRMKLALLTAVRSRTGSHVGFDFGAQQYVGMLGSGGPNSVGMQNCAAPTPIYSGVPVPLEHCASTNLWATWYWEPETYFAVRDAAHGQVTVGSIQPASDTAPAENEADAD